MSTELLLITLLYAVATLTWIGVLAVRGLWRTTVVSLLALLCFGAALYHTAQYRAHARAAAMAPVSVAAPAAAPQYIARELQEAGRLHAAIQAARLLHGSLAAENPVAVRSLSDREHREFEDRAEELLRGARRLRAEAVTLRDGMSPGLQPAAGDVVVALQSLEAAARDLHRYVRARNRAEEQLLEEGFRRGLHGAVEALQRAEARLGTGS